MLATILPCLDYLLAFPPLHLGDVRKLPDKSVMYLTLLMLLHLNREGPPGANGKQKLPVESFTDGKLFLVVCFSFF